MGCLVSRDIRDWTVVCKECGKRFVYSDRAASEAAIRGESRPERCPACRRSHNRSTQRMGAPYVDLAPGRPVLPGGLKPGRLGKLQHPNREHRPNVAAPPAIDPDRFGIKGEHIVEFLLDLEAVQVAIVIAPTGSGKSTFFPYRLMQPPPPLPEDFVTRHGKILVTQPRIEASTSIPKFVAEELHGSACGPGMDIGYKNSRHAETDTRNRLVYLTDGTLLNMIRRGELHDVAAVVIDEAHERSLNIDLIIALLRRELRALPHLKVIIASATIEVDLFRSFFEPDFDVLVAPFPGKTAHSVVERFRRTDPIPDAQLVPRMPAEVAATAYEVLRWMAYGERPSDVDASVEALDGDILCFLHGKAAINTAINTLRDHLEDDPELERQVGIYPLHAELPETAIRRALSRPPADTAAKHGRKGRLQGRRDARQPERWRVIVATTIAETSLTVEGVRHVIDSGLVNQPSWDTATATETVRPGMHSRSGLIQRRGRAGRVAPGIWHLLLTREQFDARPASTPPEIADAPLEQVVLAAAAAGVGDPLSLRWLPPGPPSGELERARAALRHVGAIDQTGDPTALGRELGASREPIPLASLLANADTTGCAVEAATALAVMKVGGVRALLAWNSDWPAATRVLVHRIHTAVQAGCADDLDAVLRLWSGWEATPSDRQDAWAGRRFLNSETFHEVQRQRAKLLEGLQPKTRTKRVRPVAPGLVERLRRTFLWSLPDGVYRRDEAGEYLPEVTPRTDASRVAQINGDLRLTMDPASRCAVTRPEVVVAVDRVRRRRWVSPLEPAAEYVDASVCIAIDPSLPTESTLLLAARCDSDLRWIDLPVLPGDRFRVAGPCNEWEPLTPLEALAPRPAIAVALADDAEHDPDVGDEDTNDLALVEAAASADTTTLEELEGSSAEGLPDADEELEEEELDTEAAPRTTFELELLARDAVTSADAVVEVIAVDADGRALCGLNREAELLDSFAEQHQIGSVVSLTIVDAVRFPRDARIVVTARHEPTGLNVLLDRNAFGLGVRDVLLERVVGKTLDFQVDYLEREAGVVEVSRTAASIAALGSLAAVAPHAVAGQVIDVWQDRLYVLLDVPDATATTPFIVYDVAAADLPVRPDEMRLGEEVRVQVLKRLDGRTDRFHVGPLDDFKMPSGALALEGHSVVASSPVPPADIIRLERASTTLGREVGARVRAGARVVGARSHRPRIRIADVTGIRSVLDDPAPGGTVLDINDDGVLVQLHGGITTRVRTRFTSWNESDPQSFEIGQRVPVYVADANPEDGHLVVSLRDPNANPYRYLVPDSWVKARIVRADDKGALRLQTDSGAELTLWPGDAAVRRGEPLSELGAAGHPIRVRIIDIDADGGYASCSMFHPTYRVLLDAGRELLVSGLEPHQAVHAFDHIPPSARVSVDRSSLTVRWLDLEPGASAFALILAALAGPLVKIATPNIRLLTENRGQQLSELRAWCGVCASVVRVDDRPHVIAAAPTEEAARRLFAEIQRLYSVRHVRVGRYRRPDMDRFEAAGFRVWWSGPAEPTGRNGYFELGPGDAAEAMSMLEACGIGVADRGDGPHPGVTLEWLAGARRPPEPVRVH